MLLPQSVPVACRRRRVIGGAIALDGQDHASRLERVLGCKIDPVARSSVLRNKRDPGSCQAISHIHLEGVELWDRGRLLAEVSAVARAVLEIGTKQFDPTGL